MSELVKCATCKTEKPFSEMQTCMHADREHSVCDMTCMIKFYKGEIKPDFVITPDLEEMVKLGMNPKEYHLYKENIELRTQLAKANERTATLEQCVIKFRQGVTHFNRTRGDLNVLLSAYADCEQLRKEQDSD